MVFDKTINDIIEYTGLKYEYIIKCTKELDSVLKPYIQRGDKNSLIFDSNALKIFDRVKQLKDGKQSISSIKVQLESELSKTQKDESNSNSNSVNDIKNMQESDLTKMLINKLEESNRKNFESLELALQTKDQVIEVQRRENQELKTQILLITDGRSPEEVRKNFIDKEIELRLFQNKSIELEEKLKLEKALADENKIVVALKEKELAEQKSKSNTLEMEVKNSKEITIKQEIILSDKENKLVSIENQKKLLELELEEQKKKTTENESKKLDLLNQLEGLEGKWFVGAKRKQLLKQLKELS